MNLGRRAPELLDRLAKLDELIRQHRATLGLLERERLQLQTRLRLAGCQPPVQLDPRPDGDEPISSS